MPEANATMTSSPGKSVAMTSGKNLITGAAGMDPNAYREPDGYVYLFNISSQEFMVERPPLMPRLRIPACDAGQTFRKVAVLPDPVQQSLTNVDTGEVDIKGHRAARVAMDICNPSNMTLDQNFTPRPEDTLGVDVDLGKRGVFWSYNETPTADELAKAKDRMEKFYRFKLNEARTWEISDPKKLVTDLGREHRLAAQYFGEETAWNKIQQTPAECPICGETLKKLKTGQIAAFHFLPNGRACVNDWPRAIAAGVVKAEDQPTK